MTTNNAAHKPIGHQSGIFLISCKRNFAGNNRCELPSCITLALQRGKFLSPACVPMLPCASACPDSGLHADLLPVAGHHATLPEVSLSHRVHRLFEKFP